MWIHSILKGCYKPLLSLIIRLKVKRISVSHMMAFVHDYRFWKAKWFLNKRIWKDKTWLIHTGVSANCEYFSINIFIPQQLLILYYMLDTLVITKNTRVKHIMRYVTLIKDCNIIWWMLRIMLIFLLCYKRNVVYFILNKGSFEMNMTIVFPLPHSSRK